MPDDLLPSIDQINHSSHPDGINESRSEYGSGPDKPKGFKGLVVWQTAMDFVTECYRVTSDFPKSETYGLVKQLREAAISVSLNIAEGWGRNSRAEFARFCDIARASLQEVDAAFEISKRLNYIPEDQHRALQSRINKLCSMLLRLTMKLREK